MSARGRRLRRARRRGGAARAQANLLGRTIDPPAAGLALAVLLHAVNFTLGLVSPTIAALRLHYVEFFDKFYDEGGAPYHPFAVTGR